MSPRMRGAGLHGVSRGRRSTGLLAALAVGLAWAGGVAAQPQSDPKSPAVTLDLACPPSQAPAETLQLRWQAQPAAWRVGQPVVLRVRLCPAGATLRAFDAHMPEHRHGMNYRPQVQALGDGVWLVQGVLLHMAGRWELRFDTERNGRLETLRETLVLR